MEADAGLGLVAVEGGEIGEVDGFDLGDAGGLVQDGNDGKDRLPGGRRRTDRDGSLLAARLLLTGSQSVTCGSWLGALVASWPVRRRQA